MSSVDVEQQLCRLCLGSSACIPIFSTSDDVQYSERIMRCARVDVNESDGLPSAMCTACEAELAVSYSFLIKCEASDATLRRLALTSSILDDTSDSAAVENDLLLLIKQEDDEKFDFKDDFDIKGEFFESDEAMASAMNVKKNIRRRRRDHVKKVRKKSAKKEKLGPIPCVTCGLLVNSRSAMDIHLRTHSGEKPYACSECDVAYTTKGTLKRHIETHHLERERKFTCETCGNRFFRKNDIIVHMRRHTGETPYACPYCSKRFQQIASLIRHKRTHTGDKPFSCPICTKSFADRSMINKHMSVHSDEKKHNCHLCEKAMKSKSALRSHLNLHSNEKLNVCNFCGMAFAAKGNLKMHISRVHSERSGQCSVCLKTFSDLEIHMRKHTGEKPFECQLCSRSFASKKSLSTHVIFKHENSSKYQCSMNDCTKSFPTPSMLEFHLLKQHTNHTPFVCQYCSRGFFRCSDLSRHLRVNHLDINVVNEPLKQEIRISVGGD